jgi:hypothetical protein
VNQRRNPNSPRTSRKDHEEAPAAAPAEPAPLASTPARAPRKSVEGWFAVAGAVICVVLNVVTDGKVPGGYAAGVIGGGLGWVFGIGMERLIQKWEREHAG